NMQPLQTRGIEYWTDGKVERIFVATLGKQLVSIDIATGKPDPNFGDNGIVDLAMDLGPGDYEINNITHGAPPIVVADTVVVGSKIFDYGMHNNSPPGHIRAYDARTGEFKWRFHTIPREGEPFVETWENDSWKKAGNTNAWSMLAGDDELGLVYLPTSTPTNDYWGGRRPGANVYAESILCLDAASGRRVWHFQTVHHGVWDYDVASAPNLVDIVVAGKPIKAVAQVSKTGFTYVFDRVTGKPVWPIEERPVPQSDVPGEKTYPTQPHPTKPPPFERLGITEDDLIDFTPELKAEAIEIAAGYRLGPIFTPPIVKGAGGKLGTIVVPGAAGGANFPGASVDPETGILYVESQTNPIGMAVVPTEPGTSDWDYVIAYQGTRGPQGLPIVKPPYRRITAIDLNTGEHVWQIPFGNGPTNHPAIKDLNLGPLGTPYGDVVAEGGILLTKTLLIGYLSKRGELGRRAQGTFLRAFDKTTGELLGEVDVDIRLHGALMTYMHKGRQYIAAAGGGRRGDGELVAFALPKDTSTVSERP
ncbi:MAG: PQQ-binding-like beta-propeller repeat protein, partial [Gammaproteobacteria bacterium]|nr:PQQ-binding-like beta-propeller repeat protein [Gammaproteobacteria bacterium]